MRCKKEMDLYKDADPSKQFARFLIMGATPMQAYRSIYKKARQELEMDARLLLAHRAADIFQRAMFCHPASE